MPLEESLGILREAPAWVLSECDFQVKVALRNPIDFDTPGFGHAEEVIRLGEFRILALGPRSTSAALFRWGRVW
ncbi:MAG: hypothetical protein OSB70_04395 [Myxococcota bacterium]|nr:hypothetical protein [Myxococcota bacterium]